MVSVPNPRWSRRSEELRESVISGLCSFAAGARVDIPRSGCATAATRLCQERATCSTLRGVIGVRLAAFRTSSCHVALGAVGDRLVLATSLLLYG